MNKNDGFPQNYFREGVSQKVCPNTSLGETPPLKRNPILKIGFCKPYFKNRVYTLWVGYVRYIGYGRYIMDADR